MFRFEVFIPDIGIIKVVECRHAERLFTESPYPEIVSGEWFVVGKKSGGKFVFPGRCGYTFVPELVLNECP